MNGRFLSTGAGGASVCHPAGPGPRKSL